MAGANPGPKKAGTQDTKAADDYGARAAWGAAAKPPSVEKYGANVKTKYRHRES